MSLSDEFLVGLIEGANFVQPFFAAVNKDECRFSCDSPFMQPDGLFVSLSTGVGVGRGFLASELPAELFLQLQFTKRQTAAEVDSSKAEIRGAKVEVDKKFSLRVFTNGVLLEEALTYPFESVELAEVVPEVVVEAVRFVQSAPSMEAQEAVVAYSAMEEKPEISRFSFSLVQETPPSGERKVDLSTDRCQFTGERCSNLWLNLSDGFIGGGRKQSFLPSSASASGAEAPVEGTDGARLHYEAQRRAGKEYPLVVKLGTITETAAEVYSYAEDAMVEDAKLDEHLQHWGIDRRSLSKTAKSLMELEYELNKDFAFDKILGHEKDAEPVTDLVGLRNLGNTCYINALLQLLARLDEFKAYAESTSSFRPALDAENLEWSKIIEGVLNPKYVDTNISPFTFRKLFCSSHPDFKTHQQQDVVEFLQFIAEKFPASLNKLFQFTLANDLVVDGHGRREVLAEAVLSLQVPQPASAAKRPRLDTEAGERSGEEAGTVIPVEECLAKTFGESEIADFRFKGEIAKSAKSRSSILTFPKYLFVAVRRYYFDGSWQPQKMDVGVAMPAMIDLTSFRASESLNLPPLDSDDLSSSPEVASLVEMGFPSDLAARALKKANGSVEAAMDLLFSGGISAESDAHKPAEGAGASELGGSGSGGNFRLVGFVSHLGKSVSTGHYVAHWLRPETGEWVLFNDEKVTACKEVPTEYGYLYLYERVE